MALVLPPLAAAAWLLGPAGAAAAPSAEGRVVVLGFDGASHATARELMAQGRLPNMQRLAEAGSFGPLGTTHNAESAVAWAALNSGRNPSETAIPGFIKRELLGPDGPVKSGGTPMPGLGYQEQQDRRVAELDAGFPVALLAGQSKAALTFGFGALVFVLFLLAFKVLLRLRTSPAAVLALILGAIGGFGARVAKGYVPEVVPGVVANPLKAEPFWETAARAGVRSAVISAAMTWDRPTVEGARVLAGLGVPDARGGGGDWFVYTTDDLEWDRPPKGRTSNLTAGTVFKVEWRDDRIETEVYGPKDFTALDALDAELEELRAELDDQSLGWKEGEALRAREEELLKEREKLQDGRLGLPLVIEKEGADRVRVTLGGSTQVLDTESWSDWYHLDFELNPLVKVHAVTRLRVLGLDPLSLYVNVLEIDPARPPFWQPISQPADYSRELVSRTGSPFETFGWACATMAFKSGEIEAEVLLEDIEFTMGWRERLLKDELARGDWELLFALFSTPDRVQHMMYQYYDPEHPLYDPEKANRRTTFFGREIALKDAIPAIYEEADRIVGYVMEELGPEDTLMVCADHGFTSFRHQFHVNSWLAKEGFLALRPGLRKSDKKLFGYVDWSRTKAYSLGLGVIYLNLKGREAEGIVEPDEADAVLKEIEERLLAAVDERPGHMGTRVVDEVTLFKDVHDGPYLDLEGDLMIGFAPYYRVSWATTLGELNLVGNDGQVVPGEVIEPNENPWSGGHPSVAPRNVPGIFLCNRKVDAPADGLHLLDIAPTALELLGVEVPAELDRPPLVLR